MKHVQDTIEKSRNCIKLQFIDSYKFLNISLENLASYLDKDKLKIIRSEFSTLSDEKFELLMRKGIFPYEIRWLRRKIEWMMLTANYFIARWQAVSYPRAVMLMPRMCGNDSSFECSTSTDLYLKTDILLLADIFENFRNSCVASYDLNPAHYYTLPDFMWTQNIRV